MIKENYVALIKIPRDSFFDYIQYRVIDCGKDVYEWIGVGDRVIIDDRTRPIANSLPGYPEVYFVRKDDVIAKVN
jgi:hypothetical protein